MLEAFGSGSSVWGQGWGPGPQAERGGGGRRLSGPVALGSGGERGPLWAKVELSLLRSGAGTTSRVVQSLKRDPAARRAPCIGLWAQERAAARKLASG